MRHSWAQMEAGRSKVFRRRVVASALAKRGAKCWLVASYSDCPKTTPTILKVGVVSTRVSATLILRPGPKLHHNCNFVTLMSRSATPFQVGVNEGLNG